MGEIRENIRRNLGHFLTLKGISQKELAEKLKVSQAAVSCWLNGKNAPDIETVSEMCDILGISVIDLFGTNGNNAMYVLTSTHEREVIDMYRKLYPETQKTVRGYIGYLLIEQQEKEEAAAREAEKQRMLDELRKIEDQEEFEKLLTASYAAWGGQHGTVKLTEEGLKEFIKLIKEDQKK